MIEITVNIAGYAFAIRALYPETEKLFEDYLTEDAPLFIIESGTDQIAAERQLLKKNTETGSRSVETFSDALIESNYFYREVAERLSRYGVILLHGSAVAVDGEAYIFVAPSGTGKSTHTRLWREAFGERAVMINDDKPLLKCTDHGIFACGSPWNGKHHLSRNMIVPLKAICFLGRAKENHIERISSEAAFMPMLTASYQSKTADREACILQSLQCVRKQIAFYRLRCNTDPGAASVSYEEMRT